MELQPITLPLDALADAARAHEVPPDELELKFPVETPLGSCYFKNAVKDDTYNLYDHRLEGALLWSGPEEAAPSDVCYAFELTAVKEGGCSDLLRADAEDAGGKWRSGGDWVITAVGDWPQLRRAVLDGCSLQLTVAVHTPSVVAATLDTRLRVPSASSSTLTAIGAMLDGPFTDVAVTAGGRTFRAHRVVLAAASPVFLSMLDGAMREAREAAVELVGADAGAVELLLRHLYGGTIEVPVSSALQLYALADQYQVAGGPQQRLRLWLMALQLAPEALCELAPAAHALCRPAFERRLRFQADDVLNQLSSMAAFPAWPLDTVAKVLLRTNLLTAFGAAAAWMDVQPRRPQAAEKWRRLLDAMPWFEGSHNDLRSLQRHPIAARVRAGPAAAAAGRLLRSM